MRSMYRFMLEIGSRLTDELGEKAEADTDFELKVRRKKNIFNNHF